MKQSYIIHEHHPRLLLFFAGWGADETPFKMYRPAASDFMVCYDYRTLDLTPPDWKNTAKSTSSAVYGGMGGFADHATALIARYVRRRYPYGKQHRHQRNTLPHRPAYGYSTRHLPRDIGRTDRGFTAQFLRRMCANGAAFKAFLEITPRRPLEELRDELTEIEKMYHTLPAATFHWQQAVTGGNDRIIPPANQLQAWETLGTPVLQTEDAHYQEELFRHYLQDLWTSH